MRGIHRIPAAEIGVALLLLAAPGSAGQGAPRHVDPVKTVPGMYTVLLENEYVRVIDYRIEPGQKDDWHTHPPKVSYVVSGGTLRITLENGDSFVVDEAANSASWLGAVGPHYVENIGTTPVRIVLIEVKSVADAPFEDVSPRG